MEALHVSNLRGDQTPGVALEPEIILSVGGLNARSILTSLVRFFHRSVSLFCWLSLASSSCLESPAVERVVLALAEHVGFAAEEADAILLQAYVRHRIEAKRQRETRGYQ